jgi:hypothetical protein
MFLKNQQHKLFPQGEFTEMQGYQQWTALKAYNG